MLCFGDDDGDIWCVSHVYMYKLLSFCLQRVFSALFMVSPKFSIGEASRDGLEMKMLEDVASLKLMLFDHLDEHTSYRFSPGLSTKYE